MAISGLAAVGRAISAAVLLVVSHVDKGLTVVVIAAFTACLFVGLWFRTAIRPWTGPLPAVNRGKTPYLLRSSRLFPAPGQPRRPVPRSGFPPATRRPPWWQSRGPYGRRIKPEQPPGRRAWTGVTG